MTLKEAELFPRSSRYKDGLEARCKVCRNTGNRNYRLRNEKKVKEARKKHYHANAEKFRKEKREYYAKNKPAKKSYDVTYRLEHKEKIRKYKKDWATRNKDRIDVKIKRNLRRRLHHVVESRYKTQSVIDLLSCTVGEFIKHLESQFEEGMTWETYGVYGWHIDHIKPCYKFDLTKPEEQKKCFHYTNLRPLWWKQNISRSRNNENEN